MPGRQRATMPRAVLLLPAHHQPRDGRCAEARGLWINQRLQGSAEVAGAHAFETQSWNQFLDGLRLPKIRRQDGRTEPFCRLALCIHLLAGLGAADDPTVPHPWLRQVHRRDASQQRSAGVMAVPDHLLPTAVIAHLRVAFDPGIDLGFDGLAQEALGPVSKNLRQNVPTGGGNRCDLLATLVHRRTPLPIVGGSEPRTSPETTPPFFIQPPSTKLGFSSDQIGPCRYAVKKTELRASTREPRSLISPTRVA